jgi:DNA-binding PucR family transcriptional regulator
LYGEEIEGSLDFLNRSENRITDIWFDFNFEDMHDEQNLQGSLEFEEEEDLWDSELYAAMLLNMVDPKWLYNYSSSLTALELTPQIIGSNQSQLYSNSIDSKFHFYDKLSNYEISQNRILNLLRRNRGSILYSPVLDFYDEDAAVDWGLDINNEYGTSMGTLSNLVDV